MKTLLVAVVVAALFAAIATHLYSTLFVNQNYLALLALFFTAATGTALATVRFGSRQQPAKAAQRRPEGERERRKPVRDRRPGPPKGAKRESGTVKWFDRNKGFGFIVRANGDEIFVHHRSVRRVGNDRAGLEDDQSVSFVAVERQRGWQAEDVAPE